MMIIRPAAGPPEQSAQLPRDARRAADECVARYGCGAVPGGTSLGQPLLVSDVIAGLRAIENGRSCGSSAGKRRPEPHGHKSFRPSFSTSSVSIPTIRLPRLT
jgi:hypothetical protein